MQKLIVKQARNDVPIHEVPFPDQPGVLGSGAWCDLVLAFPGVSRENAYYHPEANGLRLRDLDSKNGLIQDGIKQRELLLVPGSSVQIGSTILSLDEKQTSDFEMELEFGSQTRRKAWITSRATDSPTASVENEATRSPLSALRLLGAIASGEENLHFSWLRQLSEVLGAHSVGLVTSEGITDWVGPFVWEEDWSEIFPYPHHGDQLPTGAHYLTTSPRSPLETRLVAVFASKPANWLQHLLNAAQNLMEVAPPKTSGGTAQPSSRRNPDSPMLDLPDGMIVGSSQRTRLLLQEIAVAAKSNLPTLVLGESGTGKEFVAEAVHRSRRDRPGQFIPVNCAAIATEQIEAELFGIGRRVATGVDSRPGYFVQADGGTIFLDEIADLPLALQPKLLRAIQERKVHPVGVSSARAIDVRIVAATNQDLEERVRQGLFRKDLYYRLRGARIEVPPLRDRQEDLPELALGLIQRKATEYGLSIKGVSRGAMRRLHQHDWPGNIREFQTEIDIAVNRCPPGGILESSHFSVAKSTEKSISFGIAADSLNLKSDQDALTRDYIQRALARFSGNKTQAARALGVSRNGLNQRIERLSLDIDSSSDS